MVALNQPSLDKFEPLLKEGGTLIWESTNIAKGPKRKDITAVAIPAADEAIKLENPKVLNMIVLGAYQAAKGVVDAKTLKDALKKVLPERHHHLLPLNEKAMERGVELAKEALG